jgi:glycosyltransferase involved in cell wall biosynthesis
LTIREFIREHRVDVVHAHGYKANCYAIYGSALTNARRFATCHPWTETDYSLKARLYTRLDKAWLGKMDGIAAVSNEVKEKLLQRLPENSCPVIPNGIQLERFHRAKKDLQVLQSMGVKPGDFVIGTVGRLVPEKGFHNLISAMKPVVLRHPNARLFFVGDGPLHDVLCQQVSESDLQENVRFLGVRKDIPELLACFDLFVMSSVSEGLPMALLEAMAAGIPIVSTGVGEIPKVIHHGVSGMLVPPDGAAALSQAIRLLLEDRKLASNLAYAAAARVAGFYSSEKMAEQYLKLYQQILDRKNGN